MQRATRTVVTRSLSLVIAAVMALGAATLATAASSHADPPTPGTGTAWLAKLDQAARDEFAAPVRARSGAAAIGLVVATSDGAATQLADAVTQAGGTVRTVDPTADYVRISLPRTAVADVLGRDAALAADLDRVVPLAEPATAGPDGDGEIAAPGADTPEVNPYLPTEEIGAVTFAHAHPDQPQQHVRVGVVDTGIDLGHPALRRDGAPITRQWTTLVDPVSGGDPAWLPLGEQVSTDDQQNLVLHDRTYHAPHPGTFRVGYLDEGGLPAYGGDLDGDHVTGEALPVLVDGDQVWTSPAGDDFALTPPAVVGGATGLLRADDPSTPADEAIAFTAETTTRDTVDYVHLGFDEVGHATHVAGIIAGNHLYGSAADGVAPGVDLYSAQVCTPTGCGTGAMTDAVALLAREGVDVINLSIGVLTSLNDGQSATERIYTTIARTYDVVLTVSAGNDGDGTNTVNDPADADDVLGVGASVSAETWHAAYGLTGDTGVFSFSSRGLREDGALAPQVVAPGAAVSAQPAALAPTGYALHNGTSMSSPMVAGAAALLLGAARAEGRDPTAAEVRAALVSGARHLDGEDVTSEGAGQVDMGRAWQSLADTPATTITVDAPVCTPFSGLLSTPGRGPGIHQRCARDQGGPEPGHREFPVTLTRTTGAAGTVRVDLRWRTGADSLQVGSGTVDLPLGSPVTVTVGADLTAGAHVGGLLEIDDPATAAVDAFLPVSVAVGEQLDATGLSWSTQGRLTPGHARHHWVEVPDVADSTTGSLTRADDQARLRFVAFWPSGVPAGLDETSGCYTGEPESWECSPYRRSYQEPFAGLWEISAQASVRSASASGYTLGLHADAAEPVDRQVVLAQGAVGDTVPFTATFVGSAGIGDLSAFAPTVSENRYERRTLAQGATTGFDLVVPEDVSTVTGRVRSVDGGRLDVRTTLNGSPVGEADGALPGEFVLWGVSPGDRVHVQVTAVGAPGGATEVWYEDRFSPPWDNPLAKVTITDVVTTPVGPAPPGPAVPATAAGGLPAWAATTTTVTGTLTVLREARPGRTLGTNVRLRKDESQVVAQVPVRLSPQTVGLRVDSGLPDATGAEYVVYDGAPDTGVEVGRVRPAGTGTAVVAPARTPWPVFDPAGSYTVVQVSDPAGVTPRQRTVTAQVVDGALRATFAQVATPTPTPSPSASGGATGAADGTAHDDRTGDGEQPTAAGHRGVLAATGPAGALGLALTALAAVTSGLLLRRRGRPGRRPGRSS